MNNNEFAVAFPRGGSSSTVSRSNWNLENRGSYLEKRRLIVFKVGNYCV